MPHALIVTDIFGCCPGSTGLQQDLARSILVDEKTKAEPGIVKKC